MRKNRANRQKAPAPSPARPDRAAMEQAVADFLAAAGFKLNDPNLADTPKRVTEAFADEFLDGYRKTAGQALGPLHPLASRASNGLVVVTNLRFRSVCPHHLLPYAGRAHLAYVAEEGAVGFGRLSELLDCFAHRLVLQEELARQVARALSEELRSPGAACILEAEQTCFRLRGPVQDAAITHSEAYEGLLSNDADLRRSLWSRLPVRGR